MPEKSNAAESASEKLVAVFNRGGGSFIHGDYRLDSGQMLEVPQSIADLWLGHGGAHGRVVLATQMGSAKAPDAEKAKVVQENAELKAAQATSDARIAALEAQLDAAKAAAGGEAKVPIVPPKAGKVKNPTAET